jgi:hypothetical protein
MKLEVSTTVHFKDSGLLGCDCVGGLVVTYLLDILISLQAKACGYVSNHHGNY